MTGYHPAWQRAGEGVKFSEVTNTQGKSFSTGTDFQFKRTNKDGTYTAEDEATLQRLFGPPPGKTSGHPTRMEYKNLADAYTGNSLHMSNLIITMLTKSDTVWLRELLPWKKMEDSMRIEWDEWSFAQHVLDRVPEEGVPRTLVMQRSAYAASLFRWGKALRLQYEFWKTKEGMVNYAMYFKQLQTLTLETHNLQVSRAIITSQPPEDVYHPAPHGGRVSETEYTKQIDHETSMWGIVQKQFEGFDIAHQNLRRVMQERGVTGANTTIVPEGVIYYNKFKPENNTFLVSGIPGTKPRDTITGASVYGTLVESRSFKIDDTNTKKDDPFYRNRTCGEWFLSNNEFLKRMEPRFYASWQRDLTIYDENTDNEEKVSLESMFRNCGLFHNLGQVSGDDGYPGHNDGGDGNEGEDSDDDDDTGGKGRAKSLDDALIGRIKSSLGYTSMRIGDANHAVKRKCRAPLTRLGKNYFGNYANWGELFQTSGMLDDFLEQALSSPTKLRMVLDTLKETSDTTAGVRDAILTAYAARRNVEPSSFPGGGGQFLIPDPSPSEDRFPNPSPKPKNPKYQGRPPAALDSENVGHRGNDIPAADASDIDTAFASMALRDAALDSARARAVGNALKKVWDEYKNDSSPDHALGPTLADAFTRARYIDDQKVALSDAKSQYIANLYPVDAVNPELSGHAIDLTAITKNSTLPLIFQPIDPSNPLPAGDPKTAVDRFNKDVMDAKSVYKNTNDLNFWQTFTFNTTQTQAELILRQMGVYNSAGQIEDLKRFPGEFMDTIFLLMCIHSFSNPADASRAFQSYAAFWLKVKNGQFGGTAEAHIPASKVTESIDSPPASSPSARLSGHLHSRPSVAAHFRTYPAFEAAFNRFMGGETAAFVRQACEVPTMKPFKGLIQDIMALNYNPEEEDTSFENDLKYWLVLLGTLLEVQVDIDSRNSLLRQQLDKDLIKKVKNHLMPIDFIRATLNVPPVAKPDGTMQGGLLHRLGNYMRKIIKAPSINTRVVWDVLMENKGSELKKLADLVTTSKERPAGVTDMARDSAGVDPREGLRQLLFISKIENGDLLLLCVEQNLVLPLGFLLLRHMQTYKMGSMVWMVKGSGTGNTYVGHMLFTFGNNPVDRIHIGNFSMWARAIITNKANIAVAHDIYCRKYVSGGGTEFWEYGNPKHRALYKGVANIDHAQLPDIHCVAVPVNWSPKRKYIDITGNFDRKRCVVDQAKGSNKEYHYPTAELYAKYWGWTHESLKNGTNSSLQGWAIQNPRYNTVVCQGHTKAWRHEGQGQGKEAIVRPGAGHWGDRVYPGCGKVRNGYDFYLRPIKDGTYLPPGRL